METTIYNQQGKTAGQLSLSEAVFGLKWNADLVHQVLTSMRANERQGNAHTKGRGEVRGGGKKPWQQKGTGQARHGSRRSPIWVGGGMTHGPINEKDYAKKINRVMKRKALLTILSKKFKDGQVLFVDSLTATTPKTKTMATALASLAKIAGFNQLTYKTGQRALVVVPDYAVATVKSFRNLPQAAVCEAREVNPLAVASYQYLIVAEPAASLAKMPK